MKKHIFGIVILFFLVGCGAADLDVDKEEAYHGEVVKATVTGEWDEIRWFDGAPIGKCKGSNTCEMAMRETGDVEIRVKLKNNPKNFQPLQEIERAQTISVTKTGPELINVYDLEGLLNDDTDVYAELINADSSYASRLEITATEYNISYIFNNETTELNYTVDRISDNQLELYSKNKLIATMTYGLNKYNVLNLEYTIDGVKVIEKWKARN